MKALVTGANGFLGRHLVERLLEEGYQVRGLVRSAAKAVALARAGAEPVVGELGDRASLHRAAAGMDLVFHTAAHVSDWGSSWDFETINVQGTEDLLRAAAAAGVGRVLHVSTACVYDDHSSRQLWIIPETAPTGSAGDRTFGLYAHTKLRAEQAVWRAHEAGKVAVSVIRPAWIYGPGDRLILPELIGYLRSRLACWPTWGNPCVDPIYVTDVADCAIAAATQERAIGQAYNVAPDQVIGVRDFVGELCRELGIARPRYTLPSCLPRGAAVLAESWARWRGVQPVLTRAAVTVLTADLHHDPGKAMRELGWRPRVAMAEGVRRTVAWLGQQERDHSDRAQEGCAVAASC